MIETGFKAESRGPVAIRDVAAKAGVSRATASKALNPAAMSVIALATRERVQQVAREMGYYPSAIARSLYSKRIDTLGIILYPGEVSPNDSPFFGILFKGILQAAASHGQNVTLFVGETWKNAQESLPRFRDGRCDGFLIFYQPADSDLIPALLDAGVPAVLVNDRRDDPRLSWVDIHNDESAQMMTRYLLGLGHQRIALLAADDNEPLFQQDRIRGYESVIQEAHLVPQVVQLPWADASGEVVLSAVRKLMEQPETSRPTALFCLSDSGAAFAITELIRLGFRVPEDVSVAGFNDDSAVRNAPVALTTMQQPYLRIGEEAVSLLLEQVTDIDTRGRQVMLPTQLIERDSTGPIRTDS